MPKSEAYTAGELLSILSARQLKDGQVVFAGVGIPLLAATLAQRLRCPGLTILFEGGVIGAFIEPGKLPPSTNDQRCTRRANMVLGSAEVLLLLQRGYVDVGFMAVIIAGLSGYAIGKLSFKVRGAYFVIVTISFAEVTRLVALNWVELTQGPLALTNIPPYTLWIPGIGEYEFWNKTAYYYLVAVIGVLAYMIIKRLVNSRIGRAMIALKENESLASSVGIDVTRYLVLAAVVSAAMTNLTA